MTKVIINEQHSLLPQQEELIKKLGEEIELVKIPAEGINRQEIDQLAEELVQDAVLDNANIVVLSPIPLLLALLVKDTAVYNDKYDYDGEIGSIYILHNDKREKKELPNGKIISVVAQEGWELIEI